METGYDILFFWVARMMMLGLHLTDAAPFRTIYLSGLIRDPYGQKMSKTKGNTVDPLGTIDDVGADALRFAMVHGTTPGNDQRFGPAKVEHARNFANKLWNATRYVLGARPATIPDDAERRLPDATHLGPADRWVLSRAAATVAAVDRAMADFNFGEVTRLLYDAIWSEYCDWGLELAKVRLADDDRSPAEREATWWALVEALDTYLRLLHPVMPFITERLWQALPHRAGDPDLLIVARWPGETARDETAEAEVGALVDLVRAIRNARADAKAEPGAWLPLDVFVEPELGHALESLRPAIERLARGRPLRRHLTREDLHGTAGATGGLAVIAGPAEAIVGLRHRRSRPPRARTERGSRRSSRTPSACSRPPVRGSRTTRSRRRRRRRSSRARARARRSSPTRPSACATGSDVERRDPVERPSRVRRPGSPSLHAGAATICPSCPLASGGAVPLEFLKRRGGDADQPAQASTAKVAPGVPEEVVAQEYQLKLYYAGKCSEGVRLKAGPRALAELPSMLAGIAKSDVEVVEPLPLEFSQALPSIVRPSEAMQWLNAHHQLNPVTRHALVVLESIDAIDLAFDTFACGLLDGETDTSDYPEYNAVVGGVASHWDEATGDMIVRAVVGWGGRGVRGDTDRIASRILGGLLTNILANQFALGLTAVERPVPAAGRGGLVCAHCGFASGHERAFYCPKCGMRLLRG